MSYRVRQGTTVGKLHLTTMNLVMTRTPRALYKRPLWVLPYCDLQEIRKYHVKNSQSAARADNSENEGSAISDSDIQGQERYLELHDRDGIIRKLDLGTSRDEVFNYVVGFSASAIGRWRAADVER